jgi:hypothetical protein
MTNFLITRCTVFDMAGVAMIQGAVIGLRTLGLDCCFKALVFPENDVANPVCDTYLDPSEFPEAVIWADCMLDIGGLCKGYDPHRLRYIEACRKKDIPYIYMSQSFREPAKEMIDGLPMVARGTNAAREVEKVTGVMPPVGADLSFLIEPTPWQGSKYDAGFTTHTGKPWESMEELFEGKRCIQIMLKPPRTIDWEPELPIDVFRGAPPQIFGLIATLKEVHAARYHTAVGAIMAGILPMLYVDYWPKYEDLLGFYSLGKEDLRKSAMVSCELVKRTLEGKAWN